jgi:hypothetical protein
VAADIVAQVRASDVRLEAALRFAQPTLLDSPEAEWASLAAFTL